MRQGAKGCKKSINRIIGALKKAFGSTSENVVERASQMRARPTHPGQQCREFYTTLYSNASTTLMNRRNLAEFRVILPRIQRSGIAFNYRVKYVFRVFESATKFFAPAGYGRSNCCQPSQTARRGSLCKTHGPERGLPPAPLTCRSDSGQKNVWAKTAAWQEHFLSGAG